MVNKKFKKAFDYDMLWKFLLIKDFEKVDCILTPIIDNYKTIYQKYRVVLILKRKLLMGKKLILLFLYKH